MIIATFLFGCIVGSEVQHREDAGIYQVAAKESAENVKICFNTLYYLDKYMHEECDDNGSMTYDPLNDEDDLNMAGTGGSRD